MRIIVVTPPSSSGLSLSIAPRVLFSLPSGDKLTWGTGVDQGMALPPDSMLALRLPFVYSVEGALMSAQEMGSAALARNTFNVRSVLG